MADLHMNRRQAISALLAISAANALSACSKPEAEGGTAEVSLRYASDSAFFTGEELEQISAIAETIIPQTETAGAVAAGVPDVLQGLASEWGDDSYRRYMRGGLHTLADTMRQREGQVFATMSPKLRERALAKYDAAVFDGSVDDGFYKDLKSTIVTAYYMSEPGATEELAYEAVPGEWIGCAPLSDYPKTWAT